MNSTEHLRGKSSHRVKKERKLFNSLQKASFGIKQDLLQKPNKDFSRKDHYMSILLKNINANILEKILKCPIKLCIKSIICHGKVELILRIQGFFFDIL